MYVNLYMYQYMYILRYVLLECGVCVEMCHSVSKYYEALTISGYGMMCWSSCLFWWDKWALVTKHDTNGTMSCHKFILIGSSSLSLSLFLEWSGGLITCVWCGLYDMYVHVPTLDSRYLLCAYILYMYMYVCAICTGFLLVSSVSG